MGSSTDRQQTRFLIGSPEEYVHGHTLPIMLTQIIPPCVDARATPRAPERLLLGAGPGSVARIRLIPVSWRALAHCGRWEHTRCCVPDPDPPQPASSYRAARPAWPCRFDGCRRPVGFGFGFVSFRGQASRSTGRLGSGGRLVYFVTGRHCTLENSHSHFRPHSLMTAAAAHEVWSDSEMKQCRSVSVPFGFGGNSDQRLTEASELVSFSSAN